MPLRLTITFSLSHEGVSLSILEHNKSVQLNQVATA